MKVNNPYTNSTSPVDLFKDTTLRAPRKPEASAGPDRVQLSGDLKLAKTAVQAATPHHDIRQDAVARAKALLERGELGLDTERLADAMLADMTIPYDHDPS